MADSQSNLTAMTIGELVIDWIATTKGNGFIESSTFMKSLGGNAANVSIGLSRLGTRSSIVAKVGPDIQGKYLLKVLADEKPAITREVIGASQPPANITSASPLLIIWNASPMECDDVAQAVTWQRFGPFAL